ITITPAGRQRVLRVVVDSDGGVTLDDIAEVSRTVSSTLDTADVMGGQPYTLEVTSRGTERPLTRPRHWQRNVGRLVRITLTDEGVVEGRIANADDDSVMVEQSGDERSVSYRDVRVARIQIEL